MTNDELEQLKRFETLPDDCVVKDPMAARVLGISVWTLRRRNPVPAIQLSDRVRGRRVGDLRRKIRGEAAPAA